MNKLKVSKEVPNAYEIYEELKKFEPYKTIKSDLDEKMFIGKVKKYFKKIGIPEWQLKGAIEDFRKKHAGPGAKMFLHAEGLVRCMIANGDLDSTEK